MYHRISKVCFLALGIVTLVWGVALFRVRPSDLEKAQNALKGEKVSSSSNLFSTTQQERKGVVKEIWFTQEDNSRLHYRIASESSLLTIKPTGKNVDMIEKLEKIKCWMQDKLYQQAPGTGLTQQVRFLAAEEGLYRFAAQEFLAQSVALSLYRAEGHELPKEMTTKPFLKGIANDVSFAVSGKNPQFKAKHFKAELHSAEERK